MKSDFMEYVIIGLVTLGGLLTITAASFLLHANATDRQAPKACTCQPCPCKVCPCGGNDGKP